MKAIIWTKYGPPDGLQLQQIEKPAPNDNEILIKIHATTVTAGDCEMRSLDFPAWLSIPIRIFVGIRKPKNVLILGNEMAGEIEAIGKGVTLYKPGDQIYGISGFRAGTYAEYVCLLEKTDEGVLAIKPANMTFEEAAAVPVGGLEALHFLRIANLQPGQKILINGAGGSIGTFGVQLAKYYGAEVTAVDSTEKLDMLLSIGADQVIDYTREDFTQKGQIYDVVFDVVGKSPFSGSLRSLTETGFFLIANPRMGNMIRARLATKKGGKTVVTEMNNPKTADLIYLKELIEAGTIKSIIDRRYPLEQMAQAHSYVETGAKKGNVVINVEHDS